MSQQLFIIVVLLLLIGAATIALIFDARQRRIDHHVSKALSTAQAEILPSIRRTQVKSKWHLLHRLVNYRAGITYEWRPEYVLLVGAIAAGATLYANTSLGFPLPLVLVGAAIDSILVMRALFGWQRRRLATKLFKQLPDTIEIVTSAVRSGLPVNEAFRAVAREMPSPTSEQFAIVSSELAMGRPLEEAVEGVYDRTNVAEYGFFAVTLAVQTKAGGALSETLQTLADTVRQRVTLSGRAKALAGEVIFSSRALTLAPFIVGGLLHTLNPQLVDLLFTDPTGQRLLAYAGVSVFVGNVVMGWMIRRDTAI